MNTRELDAVEWDLLVTRREALLLKSITANAYQYFKDETGIAWQANGVIYLSLGEILASAEDVKNLINLIQRGGVPILRRFRNSLRHTVGRFDALARQIEKTDCRKLSQKALRVLFERFVQTALRAHCFLNPLPIADRALTAMIIRSFPAESATQRERWLTTLIYPSGENSHVAEQRAFLFLVLAHQSKTPKFDALLREHLETYGWIGARGYLWHYAWKPSGIKARILAFEAAKKNPLFELKRLEAIPAKRQAEAARLARSLHLKPRSKLTQLLELAREFNYLRTWRTDVIYCAGYRARELFFEIARRACILRDDLAFFTYQELLQAAKAGKSPISPQELANRKAFYAAILWRGTFLVLSGKQWSRKLAALTPQGKATEQTIQGRSAFPGVVNGKAKVVLTADDMGKVQTGDIFVAVMTFPHFIFAMERASAFVTDEGGILCHAAIVAREMRKPCIIGTKIATKVLKDGDLVEVDANKGVVRILNKKEPRAPKRKKP